MSNYIACLTYNFYPTENNLVWSQIAKFMGPTWGLPGSCRPQMGPMLVPWTLLSGMFSLSHDDVIKWKHFPRYWPLVRGIHRSPVNSPHKGQWRGALIFSLICVWINGWVNNRKGWWFETQSRSLWRHRIDRAILSPASYCVYMMTNFRRIPGAHSGY